MPDLHVKPQQLNARINFNSQPETRPKCHFQCSGKPSSHKFPKNKFAWNSQTVLYHIIFPFLSPFFLPLCQRFGSWIYLNMEQNFTRRLLLPNNEIPLRTFRVAEEEIILTNTQFQGCHILGERCFSDFLLFKIHVI